jgi:peptidoglycan/xylan/chitin deacetylase (PgdA/CDA1 family)
LEKKSSEWFFVERAIDYMDYNILRAIIKKRNHTLSPTEKKKWVVKSTIAYIFYYSYLVKLYQRIRLYRKNVILMYHNLINDISDSIDYSPDGMFVSTSQFEMHIKYLLNNYRIVDLDQCLSSIPKNESVNQCTITFDDGWKSVYEIAYPIIMKHKIPITVFLTTNYMDSDHWDWTEQSKYLLAKLYLIVKDKTSIPCQWNFIKKYNLTKLQHLKSYELGQYLINKCRELEPLNENEKIAFLEKLKHYIKSEGLSKNPFLSWDNINEMAKNLISFGAHTMSHPNLTECENDKAEQEIKGSKYRIESVIGKPVDKFAYPYGKFNDKVKEIVKESGFKTACTTIGGFVSTNSDQYELNRINIHSAVACNLPMFSSRVINFLGKF